MKLKGEEVEIHVEVKRNQLKEEVEVDEDK